MSPAWVSSVVEGFRGWSTILPPGDRLSSFRIRGIGMERLNKVISGSSTTFCFVSVSAPSIFLLSGLFVLLLFLFVKCYMGGWVGGAWVGWVGGWVG